MPGKHLAFVSLLLWLLLVAGKPFRAFSQQLPDQVSFTNYSVNHGLSQSSVHSILQDKQGFMWFATADGLNKFDGYKFTVYRHNPLDSNSIASNFILKLIKDESGNIWIGHLGGLSRYDPKTNRFRHFYNVKNKNTEAIPLKAEGNSIWFWVNTEGLLKLHQPTGRITYRNCPLKLACARSGFIRSTLVDHAGNIWLVLGAYGLLKFNPETHQYQTYFGNLPENRLKEQETVHAIAEFSPGVFYVAASNYGLITFHEKTGTVKKHQLPLKSGNGESLTCIFKNSPDELLLGTALSGLFSFNVRTGSLRNYQHTADPNTLAFNFVECVVRDNRKTLWIATNGNGFSTWSPYRQKFVTRRLPSQKNGLFGGQLIKAFYTDRQDNFYIGTYNHGFTVTNHKTRQTKIYAPEPGNKKSFPSLIAIGIVPENDTLLWINGDNQLFLFNRFTEKFTNVLSITENPQILNEKLGSGGPNVIYKTSDGTLFMGGFGGFIILKKNRHGGFTAGKAKAPKRETILSFYEDREGTIWVGSEKSFLYKRKNSSNWVADSVASDKFVKVFYEDQAGIMWMGTTGGLLQYHKKTGAWKRYDANNGLPNDFIYGILPDALGRLWLSTNQGLSCFNPKTETFENYDVTDGLQANEFNTGAYYKDRFGALYFGGVNGYNAFKPEIIRKNLQPPAIALTSFKIHDTDAWLDSLLNASGQLQLPFDQNILSFEFAALDFTNPVKNQYAYKMEGLDPDWVYAGSKRFARYSNLPPGQYIFKVKASNNDGIWNEKGVELPVIIAPPFWQTWWFISAVSVLVLSSLIGAISLWQRQKYLKQLRRLELNQKIQLERERISRDLHDNVGSQLSYIISNLDYAANPLPATVAQPARERLGAVSDVARSTMENLRETIWALNKEAISVDDFSDKLKQYLNRQVAFSGFELTLTENLDATFKIGPAKALNMFRIAQEAVTNILKHSGGTKINVVLKAGLSGLHLSISDNGKGLSKPGPDSSGHYGLSNMRFRAKEIGADFAIKTNQASGTEIDLFLPENIAQM